MTEDSPKDKKELLITLVIVASVIIASTLLYLYWSDEPDNAFEPIDRSINFPEDEGLHNETFERWTFFGNMITDEGDEFEILIRWLKHIDGNTVNIEYLFRDNDNLTETPTFELDGTGQLDGAYDVLDFTLTGGNTITTMETTSRFKYQFYTEIDTDIVVDLNVESRKNPILYGDEGRIYQPGFGTIFGYYQPQLIWDGIITIPEIGEIRVEGKGWLDHMWGGEIKSIMSETWHIHLDNSVEIFLTKLYNPGTHEPYPNDMILYAVNIIRTDGKLLTPDLMEDIHMENLDYRKFRETYIPEPVDRYRYLAWSSEWRLHGSDIDLTISLHGDSIHETRYIGMIRAEGFYMGQRVKGQGFSELNYRYDSYPEIKEVKDDFRPMFGPTDPVTIEADIAYIPPIDLTDIYMRYRVDEGEWIREDMEIDEGYWYAVIPSQNFGSTVEYQVVVTDMVNHTVRSQIQSYYIDYV